MANTLYGEIAEKILRAIEEGSLREGEKIPSLRTLSSRYDVSLNTIKEAYALLESRRYIEGRPQSGFFVRRRPPPLPRSRSDSLELLDPTRMTICRIFGTLKQRDKRPGHLLSTADLDPELLPDKLLASYLIEQARLSSGHGLDYQHLPGDPVLREEIARLSLDAGIAVSPEDVIVTNGCTEAFNLAIRAVCRPGDVIAVESPTYGNFPLFCEELGLRVMEIPSDPAEGLNLDVLRFALDQHPIRAVLIVPNYNNPLGTVLPEVRKKALVDLLERRGVPLIEDDAFGELGFGSARPGSCKAYDRTGNVMYCSSFSKNLVPGWRVGWILAGKWTERVVEMKSLWNLTTNSICQKAVGAYLKNESFERHLRRLRARLAYQMGALQEAVAKFFPSGTRLSRPLGGLVLWVELNERIDTLSIYHRVLPQGVSFTPGPVFSASGKFSNCLRLNAGFWNQDIEAAVEKLGCAISSWDLSGEP